jgi:glycosyltransferase involved in cell wall biosynthesis
MIRLCVITTVPDTIRAFLLDQLNFLAQQGYYITVITSKDETVLKQTDFHKNIILCHVSMSRTVNIAKDFKALRQITKIIKSGDFDIVQYSTPKGALLGSIAATYARTPVRRYLMWGLYFATQTGFRYHFFRTIERLVCRLSTHICPDSKGNAALVIEEKLARPGKVQVIGDGSANGVDINRFSPEVKQQYRDLIRKQNSIQENEIVIGCIAAMVGDKGINELVAAFEIISQTFQNVHLLYIGEPAEKDPVRPETEEKLKKLRKITHLKNQRQPERYFAAMDIFVLPTYREGLGVVNIEACAMELPVVTTDIPGPREVIINGETGILVAPKTVGPLVQAIASLISNPVKRTEMGKSGRKSVTARYHQKELWRKIDFHLREITGKSQLDDR